MKAFSLGPGSDGKGQEVGDWLCGVIKTMPPKQQLLVDTPREPRTKKAPKPWKGGHSRQGPTLLFLTEVFLPAHHCSGHFLRLEACTLGHPAPTQMRPPPRSLP